MLHAMYENPTISSEITFADVEAGRWDPFGFGDPVLDEVFSDSPVAGKGSIQRAVRIGRDCTGETWPDASGLSQC